MPLQLEDIFLTQNLTQRIKARSWEPCFSIKKTLLFSNDTYPV